jgi:hypothetical protein
MVFAPVDIGSSSAMDNRLRCQCRNHIMSCDGIGQIYLKTGYPGYAENASVSDAGNLTAQPMRNQQKVGAQESVSAGHHRYFVHVETHTIWEVLFRVTLRRTRLWPSAFVQGLLFDEAIQLHQLGLPLENLQNILPEK